MLGMAFFKSLIKEHGKTYFEPIGRALQAAGIRKPNLANPAHAWALRHAAAPYAKWWLSDRLTFRSRPALPAVPAPLAAHAEFAAAGLVHCRREITGVMTKHQLGLADRQCRVAELSQRVQDHVVILATSLWAAGQQNEIVHGAADILCRDLTGRLTGRRPTDRYFRTVTKLGETIAAGGFEAIAGVEPEEILMPYSP
jgi:hypothetical protein